MGSGNDEIDQMFRDVGLDPDELYATPIEPHVIKESAWSRMLPRFCADAGITADPKTFEEMAAFKEVVIIPFTRRAAMYGMDLSDYVGLFDEQDGRCAICHIEPSHKHPDILVVDHNHDAAKHTEVRGLLCQRCNIALGLFRDSIDSLESAIAYINRPASIHFTKKQKQTDPAYFREVEERQRQEFMAYLVSQSK